MSAKKKTPLKEEKLLNWKILFLIAVSFIAYYPTLSHDFVNWDDIAYIMNNKMITSFSWENLRKIFSTYFMGNYHPLVILSFSFDYHFFKLAAPGYHVHNLILHILDAFLIYTFFFHLLKKNSNIAITIALLFALHPMHVESVAWVSERKDVLYTAWYFLALLSWLFFLKTNKYSYYFLALGCFIVSNLSKAQAVTLPVVLILIDYFHARKPDLKMVLEKIPFFAISLVFGIVAIFAQKASNYINPMGIPVSQSLFYAPYSVWVYLVKFVVPFNQIGVYEYPVTAQGAMPFYMYLSPVIFLLFLAAVVKTWKSNRFVTFGLLFFMVTIFPVLQFLPVGGSVVSERYTYIPYLGLSLIAAVAFWNYRSALQVSKRNLADGAAILVLIIFSFLTWNRTLVWKDSIALWTDVIEKNPESAQAYTNRAFMYNENKELDKALKDLTYGIKLDPNDAKKLNFYASRAYIYKKMDAYALAVKDYTSAINKNPGDYKPYLDRGIMYTDRLGKYDSGISDFKKYLEHMPGDVDAIFNLGVAFYKNNDPDSAKKYFLKIVGVNPANGQAHNLLANIYYRQKNYTEAYNHAILAKQCGINVDNNLITFLTSLPENKNK